MSNHQCQFIQATSHAPGAIGILQLLGDNEPVLQQLTGEDSWPIGMMRWVQLDDIDDGLAGRLTENIAQIMPHGGPRVMQQITQRLNELGASPGDGSTVDPRALYPEAHEQYEALMLLTLARAESPLAVELLLDQPRRWRQADELTDDDHQRAARLNRLIDPPIVVLAGPANVGKSTLSNALLGRSMSITLDQPGTTRDFTAGRIDLAGLVVDWHDTPGLRETSDDIEQRSIELAHHLMNEAELLIAMTDHESDWPTLPREPDLRIANKCDLAKRDEADLNISATTGHSLDQLVQAVRDRLVPPTDLEHPGPWLFDERLPL